MSEQSFISDLLDELSPEEQELISGGQGYFGGGLNSNFGTLVTRFGTTSGAGFSNAYGSGFSREFSTGTSNSFNSLFGNSFRLY